MAGETDTNGQGAQTQGAQTPGEKAPGGPRALVDFAAAGGAGAGEGAGEGTGAGGGGTGNEGGGAGSGPELTGADSVEMPAEDFLLDLPEGQRPDWLPENFLKDGKLNLTALNKSRREAVTAFRNRASLAPERYEIQVPDTLAEAGYGVPDDDPLLTGVSDWARKRGLSQADVAELTGLYFDAVGQQIPDHEGEMTALKTHYGDARAGTTLQAIGQWAAANVRDEAQLAALSRLAMTADGVKALDALRKAGRERTIPGAGDQGGLGRMTEQDIRKLQESREYQDGDPATVKKVRDAWAAATKGR